MRLRSLGIRFVDLLLYGDFWIAACATALVWQTQHLLLGTARWSPLVAFVWSGTLFTYALHRSIGLRKLAAFADHGRYRIIVRFRRHIRVYAALGAAGALYTFWLLSPVLRWWIVVPAVVSVGYVLPVPGLGGRRLRDLAGLKIFLIAGSFAWVTVVLPAVEAGLLDQWYVWLLVTERAAFVFALTVPFDVRDRRIDAAADVTTLPALLGNRGAIRLALLALALAIGCSLLLYRLDVYAPRVAVAVVLSLLVSGYFVHLAPRRQHDYYFTGLLDGLMLLQAGWVLG